MKIERIDDKTVKCFLSNEELEEYDIDYKDFVTRSDKAKEVVQEIIEGSPGKTGIIQYGKRLHRHIPTYALFVHAIVEKGGRQHLRQTLPCIINSFGSRGADDDISGSRFQTVCLRPVLLLTHMPGNAKKADWMAFINDFVISFGRNY